MRLAFLIPAPDVTEPWRWALEAEADALRLAGVEVQPIVWTEARDLSEFDLILPLLAWGYHRRYVEWRRFLDRLEAERLPVVNPPELLRWNSDKAYLAELGEAGIPSVPTIAVERLTTDVLRSAADRFGTDELVIKPAVSAGADGTERIRVDETLPTPERHGRTMIQPFLPAIADEGEYSLMLFDGAFSHAVVKRPPPGDFRVQPHFGGAHHWCEAPAGGEALAAAALAAAPAEAVYARVDMIRGTGGELQIMELELVEPALFLDHSPDGGEAFTHSVLRAAERLAKEPLPER